ncbi:hypothetical protein CSC45_0672 [Pseudomonas aeruginosa]|nr:hypothetical protein CSC45_0672 [Pseudomonas aeruginosa]
MQVRRPGNPHDATSFTLAARRAWLLSRADNVNRLTKCAEGERFQVGFALQRRTLHDRQAWKGTEASEASGRIANTSLTS